MARKLCPFCGSDRLYFNNYYQSWRCIKCEKVFPIPQSSPSRKKHIKSVISMKHRRIYTIAIRLLFLVLAGIAIYYNITHFDEYARSVTIGVISGAVVGSSVSSDKKEIEVTGLVADITEVNRAFNTMTGIIVGGVLGFAVGALAGAAMGADKQIQVEGKSESEIQEILEKLRKKARIKNAQ